MVAINSPREIDGPSFFFNLGQALLPLVLGQQRVPVEAIVPDAPETILRADLHTQFSEGKKKTEVDQRGVGDFFSLFRRQYCRAHGCLLLILILISTLMTGESHDG